MGPKKVRRHLPEGARSSLWAPSAFADVDRRMPRPPGVVRWGAPGALLAAGPSATRKVSRTR